MPEMSDEDLFFGESPEAPQKQRQEDPFSTVSRSVNDVERRLRVLEERYANLRKKTQITDQNMLEHEKTLSVEMKSLVETVNGLKFQVEEIAEKLSLLNAEFDNLAKKRDLKILEKYLDLWQPMNFVTRTELQELMKEK